MFKLILLILISFLVLSLLILFFIVSNNNKLIISSGKVKYTPNNRAKRIFEKNGTISTLNDVTNDSLFYYLEDWSIKNNNYINIKEKYYILEKGHYYYILNKNSLVINNNCKIILLDITNNRISFTQKNA